MPYGICGTKGCSKGYDCHSADRLLDMLRVNRFRENEGCQTIPEILPILRGHARHLYERSTQCLDCQQPLVRNTRPTLGLAGDERAKLERINLLLAEVAELQRLGVLRFPE